MQECSLCVCMGPSPSWTEGGKKMSAPLPPASPRRCLRQSDSPPEFGSSAPPEGFPTSDSRLASSSDSFHRSGVGSGAGRLWRGLGASLLSVPLLVIFGAVAQAQVECSNPNPDGSYSVPEDWELIPAGLSPGSRFRLLFVTSTRRLPNSTNIAVYNTFVQNRAKAGHAAISDSCGNLFKVVGSTAAVNARVNTDTEASDADAAIYWLKGVKVADDYADFYDGSWDNTNSNGLPYKDEYGLRRTEGSFGESDVATGTNNDGTTRPMRYFGATTFVAAITLDDARARPFYDGTVPTNIARIYYGLSPVFTAAQHVITISADAPRVTEGESVSFTLRAEPVPSRDIKVRLDVRDSGDFARRGQTGTKQVTLSKGRGSLKFVATTQDDGTEENHGAITVTVRPGSYIVGAESEARVRVSDDEITATLIPDISSGGTVLPEGARMPFNLVLSKHLDGDQTITLPLTRGGTASALGTYRLSQHNPQVITLPDYHLYCWSSRLITCNQIGSLGRSNPSAIVQPSITFHGAELNKRTSYNNKLRVGSVLGIEVIEDNTAESNETITLSLGGGEAVRLTIKDAPSSVTLSFSRGYYSVRENGVRSSPVLSVDTRPGQDIVVPLVYTDITATRGEDYVAEDTVTFVANGSTSFSFDINLLDDMVYEGDETFRVKIDASRLPDWVRVGSRASAVFQIRENDAEVPVVPVQLPQVSFDSGTYRVTEGGQVSITVSIDVERPTATTVPINYTDVSAVSSHSSFDSQRRVSYGQDYEVGPAEVVIPAEAGGSHTFTVQTVDDSTTVVQEEGNETFRVSLGELPAGIGKGSPSTATVTIVDDDVRDPALRVSSIERDLPSVSPTAFDSLTWRVTFSEDVRNVDKSDFRLSGTTATLSTSSTGGPSIYKVVASGGDLADLNGTVVLSFASNRNIEDSNGNRLVNTRPTGANEDHFVVENSVAPTVIITGGTAITKGGNAVFTLTANPAPPSPLTVMVTVTQRGNVVASNNLLGSKTVIIPPSGSMTHTVATEDDRLEGNRRVIVTVDQSANYTVGNPSSASVTVNDNDSTSPSPSPPTTPTITIRSGNPNPVTEGAGANFTVTATPPPLSPLNVTVTVTQTGDFVASGNLSSQTVTIPPSGSMTHTVATVNDTMMETNGMVRVTVSQGAGYTVGSLASAAVRVNDDDDGTSPPPTAPTVTIMGGLSPITEGTAAAFTVSRSGPVTAPLPVLLRVRETTTGGQDFVATAQEGVKTVTIPSGAATAPYTVTTVDDNTAEPDGMVTVTLNSSSAYLVGSPSAAAVNVNDDDGRSPAPPSPAVTPVVSITGGGGIAEGQAATFTVTAVPAPPPGEPISVNVAISDSGNFLATGQSGSRSIAIDNSGMARFTVSIQDDAIHEDHGRITATVEGGSGYTPHASNGSASVRVEDDDPALMLSVSRLKVTEGGSASYTIALDTRPSGDVTVAISGDAATDLTLTPTSLTFTPSNWNRPQRVTITAPEDTDFIGAAIDLTHTASGPNYVGIIATVTVAVVATDPTEEAKAWQLRLGRTVSHQVVDALQDRLSTPPAAGLQLTVAGEAITSAPPLAEHEGLLSKALGFDPLTAQALVEDSSFSFAPEQEGAAPRLAFWGQGAFSSFRGEEEDLSLDGSVTTLLLGADWSRQRWQAGAALSQSWGDGSYEGDNSSEGEITSTVTGLFPYGRYALTPRLGLWAVAGYGWGQLSLKPDGTGDDATPSTTMTMAALGMDGLLFDGGNEGITLSATADVLTLKTTSEEVDGLESSEGSLSRLRLGIEAVRPFPLSNGASLIPSLALGIRQDSGDAESGFGVDLGAGILWQTPERGISSALKGHTLLTHGEEDLQEQGLALSFSWAPTPSKRGPSLSLSHAMGATAAGGMDALLNPTTFEGLDDGPSSGQQFEAELAYGFPAHNNQLTLTPAVALALSPTSRNYSLLWSLAPYTEQDQGEQWQLSLAGERQEHNAAPSPPDHSLKLTFSSLF